MAEVQPVGFDGHAVSVVTPDIQRLLDLMQAGGQAEAEGLTSAEWAAKMQRGDDFTARAIRKLVAAGHLKVGYQRRANVLGVLVRVPVYALKPVDETKD